MNCRRNDCLLLIYFAGAMLIFAGCAPQLRQPTRICPGKQSAMESLASLRQHSQDIQPLKATGTCLAKFYTEDRKYDKENFPVRLWINPPNEICLQGDLFLNPSGIVLGSNEREFWLLMKPKEISTYWWGKWSEQSSSRTLMVNPKTLLEAFGIAAFDSEENWSLSNEGPFDVLTKRDDEGRIVKKIYIYNCDHRIFKIEYFDASGRAVVVAELYKYKEISDGFVVPGVIKIVTRSEDGSEDSVLITLRTIRAKELSEELRDELFNLPKLKGFKHIIDVNKIE